MRIKTRAPKRKRPEILTQKKRKRKRKMERNQDRDEQSVVCLNERDALMTFHAHLHLSVGRYWTGNVWQEMVLYYENLAKSPANVASLKLAWHTYSLEYELIRLLRDFGIRYEPVYHTLVGHDSSCWDAAEVKMPGYKEVIQNMRGRVHYNYLLNQIPLLNIYLTLNDANL